MRLALGATLGAGLALAAAPKAGGEPLVLPGDAQSRLEARARLEALSLNLRSYPSATTVLRVWCEDYGLAEDPKIRAVRVSGADKPLRPEDRAALRAAPDEEIRYRRVQLVCGERVLSEADNWYRPGQLTPEMVAALEATDTPFGAVAAPLRYHRRTLSTRMMFQPLAGSPRRRPRRGAEPPPLVVPAHVLEHRAVLVTAAGEPISLVVETYTGEVLAGRLRPELAAEALGTEPPPAAGSGPGEPPGSDGS